MLTNLRIAVAALLIGLFAGQREAGAHDAPEGWAYDQGCCSGQDCRHVEDDTVTREADGYHYNGQIIRFDDSRIKNSKDRYYHVCEWPEGGDMSVEAGGRMSVHCLYVPQPGV